MTNFKVGDLITWDSVECDGDYGYISRIEISSDDSDLDIFHCDKWYSDKEMKHRTPYGDGFIYRKDAIMVKPKELSLKEEIDELENQINIFREMYSDLKQLSELAETYNYELMKKEK